MEREILIQIERDLEQFEIILLMPDNCVMPLRAYDGKKLLVLSAGALPVADDQQIAYRQITKKAQDELLELYNMYEFSDRFRVVSGNRQFGSVWNYVDAGILTEQEALEALAR